MNPLMNPVGSNAEGKLNCINAVVITHKNTGFRKKSGVFLTFESEMECSKISVGLAVGLVSCLYNVYKCEKPTFLGKLVFLFL